MFVLQEILSLGGAPDARSVQPGNRFGSGRGCPAAGRVPLHPTSARGLRSSGKHGASFSDPDPRADPHDDFARIRICIKINADPKHWMVPHNSTKYGRRNAYIRKTAKQIVKNANMSELI